MAGLGEFYLSSEGKEQKNMQNVLNGVGEELIFPGDEL